jgi:hypothetical protein
MSNYSSVKCPNCKHEFQLEEAIASEIETKIKARYIERFTKDQKELAEKEKLVQAQLEQVKKQQEEQERIIADKIKIQRSVLEQEAIKKAAEEVDLRVKMMEKELSEKTIKIKEAQQKELELLQKEKQIKEKEESLKLDLEKQLLDRQKEIEDRTKRLEAEKFELKVKELEKKLSDQIELAETMRRKAEQGSMQLQGEVQELALEELLKSSYPFDSIEEVGKGVKGADCMQFVRNNQAQLCGKIIYESKRTKAFANEWIEKLKSDMRAQQADIAVIVTETLPKEMDTFGMKDGVWICRFSDIKALSFLLRDSLIKINGAIISQENKGDKMHLLYNYLTGNEFKQQIEAIVEGFVTLKESISKERIQMEKIWKEREKQLEKVLLNTTHFYGSVKGIAGNAIGDIKALELGE